MFFLCVIRKASNHLVNYLKIWTTNGTKNVVKKLIEISRLICAYLKFISGFYGIICKSQ